MASKSKSTKVKYYSNHISKLAPGKSRKVLGVAQPFPTAHPKAGLNVAREDVALERANIHFAAAQMGVHVRTSLTKQGELRVSLA